MNACYIHMCLTVVSCSITTSAIHKRKASVRGSVSSCFPSVKVVLFLWGGFFCYQLCIYSQSATFKFLLKVMSSISSSCCFVFIEPPVQISVPILNSSFVTNYEDVNKICLKQFEVVQARNFCFVLLCFVSYCSQLLQPLTFTNAIPVLT